MRVGDDDGLHAAQFRDAGDGLVVDVRDAVPEDVSLGTAEEERALPDCDLGLGEDGDDAGMECVFAEDIAVFPAPLEVAEGGPGLSWRRPGVRYCSIGDGARIWMLYPPLWRHILAWIIADGTRHHATRVVLDAAHATDHQVHFVIWRLCSVPWRAWSRYKDAARPATCLSSCISQEWVRWPLGWTEDVNPWIVNDPRTEIAIINPDGVNTRCILLSTQHPWNPK